MPKGTPNITNRGGSGNYGGGRAAAKGGGGGGRGLPPAVKRQNWAAKTYITKDPKRIAAAKKAAETRRENERLRLEKSHRIGMQRGVKQGVRVGGTVAGVGSGAVGYLAGRNDERRKQQKLQKIAKSKAEKK